MQVLRLQTAARGALALAAILCAWGTILAPQGIEAAFVPWDKAAHFIACYGLTILLFTAFPARRRIDLALLVVFLGCGVEVAQQMTGRDAGLDDVAADAAGAFAVLAPLWLERLRAPPKRERRARAASRVASRRRAPARA